MISRWKWINVSLSVAPQYCFTSQKSESVTIVQPIAPEPIAIAIISGLMSGYSGSTMIHIYIFFSRLAMPVGMFYLLAYMVTRWREQRRN